MNLEQVQHFVSRGQAAQAAADREIDQWRRGRQAERNQRRKCRICGCTNFNACVEVGTGLPCYWIQEDLCSACASPAEREKYRLPIDAKKP